MIGIDRKTGQAVSGWTLFVSLVDDVLTTQKGSRQKRRLYGSRLPELLAKLANENLAMLAMVYTAEAFADPDNGLRDQFALSRVVVTTLDAGLEVRMLGKWQGQDVDFSVPIVRGK